jgi:hypothetical protein
MTLNEAIQYLNNSGFLVEQKITYPFWKRRVIAYLSDRRFEYTEDCESFVKQKYEEGLSPTNAAKELISNNLLKKNTPPTANNSVGIMKELEKLVGEKVKMDGHIKERIGYYKQHGYNNYEIAHKLYNYVKIMKDLQNLPDKEFIDKIYKMIETELGFKIIKNKKLDNIILLYKKISSLNMLVKNIIKDNFKLLNQLKISD